jgi:ATP-dependent Zn protease
MTLTTQNDPPYDWQAAVHEAGHAVAHIHLQREPTMVFAKIIPNGVFVGGVGQAGFAPPPIGSFWPI